MNASLDLLRQLRDDTGAGVMDCREALAQSGNDIEKAKEFLRKKGVEKAGKKADRVMKSGLVYSYIHGAGRVGAMIELGCETDFVAKTEDFQNLCKEISMQIASMSPLDVESLLSQPYIRDSKKSIRDLITELIAKIGENIQVIRFVRFELGEVSDTGEE